MRGSVADDLAGIAGGAFSALAGLRRELGELVRSATDEAAQRLALASREEVEVLRELLQKQLRETEALAARVAALEARLAPPPPEAEAPAGTEDE
jgi:BMFP domain-containing protein YqiC